MISVAMATYNGHSYIREQLDTIIAQDWQGEDWELVVTDDCSKDDTVAILKEYAKRQPRLRVYTNEHNLGFLRNFERAISLCKGEYIAFSDQDDIWLKWHISSLKEALDSSGALAAAACNVCVSSTGRLYTDARSVVHPQFTKKWCDTTSTSTKLLVRAMYKDGTFHGASMMIRRELLEYGLPFPPDIEFHDFWLSCIAMALGRGIVRNEIITFYREHEHTVTKHSNPIVVRHLNPIQKLFNIKHSTVKMVNSNGVTGITKAILERVPNLTPEVRRLLEYTRDFSLHYKERLHRLKGLSYYFKYITPVIHYHWKLRHKIRFAIGYVIL